MLAAVDPGAAADTSADPRREEKSRAEPESCYTALKETAAPKQHTAHAQSHSGFS